MNSFFQSSSLYRFLSSIVLFRVKIESEAWVLGYNDVRHLHAYYWLLSPAKQSIYRDAYADGQRCRTLVHDVATHLARREMKRMSASDYRSRRGTHG